MLERLSPDERGLSGPEERKPNFKVVADNRRARYDYEIGETFEAGLMLTGPEVKSLRTGKATVAESYAAVDRTAKSSSTTPTSPNISRRTGSTMSRSGRANCCCTPGDRQTRARASSARA